MPKEKTHFEIVLKNHLREILTQKKYHPEQINTALSRINMFSFVKKYLAEIGTYLEVELKNGKTKKIIFYCF